MRAQPSKPEKRSVRIKQFPIKLRERPQWILWQWQPATGKKQWTKVPYQINGQHASTTDPDTWATCEEITDALARERWADGMGYVFSADDPYCGIDLDEAVNKAGELNEEARKIVALLNTYAELSVSRTGVHVICEAVLNTRGRKGAVEVYSRGRFFVVTGEHIPGAPRVVRRCQEEFDTCYLEWFGHANVLQETQSVVWQADVRPVRLTLEMLDLLERARRAKNAVRFEAAWNGDDPDDSEADYHLVCQLRFWTSDPGLIEAIMLSSPLVRQKWYTLRGGVTYLRKTIERALEEPHETYNPNWNNGRKRSASDPLVTMSAGLCLPTVHSSERMVLSAMLCDSYAAARLKDVVEVADFAVQRHARIFQAICRVLKTRTPLDVSGVAACLTARRELEEVGGEEFLQQLADQQAVLDDGERHAELVRNMAVVRRMARVGAGIIEACAGNVEDPLRIVSDAEAAVRDAGKWLINRDKGREFTDAVLDAGLRYQDRDSNPIEYSGLPSGLKEVDNVTDGFQAGEVTVVSGLPGAGKTMFGGCIAKNVCLAGGRTVMFSLEMSEQQLVDRIVAAHAGVDAIRLRKGKLDDEERARRNAALPIIRAMPLYVDDSSSATPSYVLSVCRRQKEKGLSLVVIDYLHHVHSDARMYNRNEEEIEIMRLLKEAARELDVPIILLAQLRKPSVDSKGRPPDLDDLMGSRAIAAEAYLVILLRQQIKRDGLEQPATMPQKLTVQVMKNRGGRLASVDVMWTPAHGAFGNCDTNFGAYFRQGHETP